MQAAARTVMQGRCTLTVTICKDRFMLLLHCLKKWQRMTQDTPNRNSFVFEPTTIRQRSSESMRQRFIQCVLSARSLHANRVSVGREIDAVKA